MFFINKVGLVFGLVGVTLSSLPQKSYAYVAKLHFFPPYLIEVINELFYSAAVVLS